MISCLPNFEMQSEVVVWSDLSLMRRSAPVVEHESALKECVD